MGDYMLYIDVPFQEKDEVKALGAKWNPSRKSWYVEDYNDYLKFKKWIPKTKNGRAAVICDYFYVVSGRKICKHCGNYGTVVVIGIKNTVWIEKDNEDGGSEVYDFGVLFINSLRLFPKNVVEFMEKYFCVRFYTSGKYNNQFFRNVCKKCGKIYPMKDLLESWDSPFEIYDYSYAEKLKLYKFYLKEDIVVYGLEKLWNSSMDLIEEYAEIKIIH